MSGKYLLILPSEGIDKYLYRDILCQEDIRALYLNRYLNSNILRLMRRIHRSETLNAMINLPFRSLWDKKELEKAAKNVDCLIFSTISLVYLDKKILLEMKQKHRMVLIIYDSLGAHSHHLKVVWKYIFEFSWDLILSFDKHDCEKYGFKFLNYAMYSKLPVIPSGNKSDIYFIGKNKCGRNANVIKLYEYLIMNGIKCNFNLKEIKHFAFKDDNIYSDGVNIMYENIPYDYVLKDVCSSNCILEYLQDDQKAQSLRYFEAVCYNKKLLTNNPDIDKLPFYNPRYMKYFKNITDIDVEWIRNEESINYFYDKRFSPKKMITSISEYFVE